MRKIIHVDMDAFFAAVEMRDNPALRNVPMAVGGSSDRRGVISTSNYEARKYGVRSAMATAHALKLCPQLVLVRGRMQKYKEASDIVFEVFREYTDLVQGLSWDEAYLDVTDCDLFNNSATLIAQDIRKKIFERTGGLTASAGIAPNKLLAKLASDLNKPNGQFTIAPHEIEEFIKKIPVEKIHGVGKVTAKYMHDMNIKTCLDMQRYSRLEMINLFGKFGDALFDYCRGFDDRDVETDFERKSLSTEETYAKDISDFNEMKEHVKRMTQEVREALEDYEDRVVKNLHVKIKYFDFKLTTIERAMPFSEENFLYLLEERWNQDPRPIRLLGVGVKFEDAEELSQLPLFDVIHDFS
jgi:DNA polymerase IV